jgi:hypothetical protein
VDGGEAARLVIDRYSAQIIFATGLKAKSAQMLSEHYAIPIAACYRRIKALESLGILVSDEKFLTQRGKWTRLYLSRVKEMAVQFESGKLIVHIHLRDGQVRTIREGMDAHGEFIQVDEAFQA